MTDKLKKIVAEAMNNRPSDFKSLVEEVLSAKQKAFVAKKLDEASSSDDRWVHIKQEGNWPSPSKDKIVGYSKPTKNAPNPMGEANTAMRVYRAKEKGYVVETSDLTK